MGRVKKGNAWHPAKDQLRGTESYGTYNSDPTADVTWSIKFPHTTWTEMITAGGSLTNWVYQHTTQFWGNQETSSILMNAKSCAPIGKRTHIRSSGSVEKLSLKILGSDGVDTVI